MNNKIPRVFMRGDGDEPIEITYTQMFAIGTIGNAYGCLELFLDVADDGVACYWGIADWDGRVEVEQIPIELCNALLDYDKCLKSNNKIDG